MNELKARVVECVRTYQRLPGRVGPAKIGSAMPQWIYEAGDYGAFARVQITNPETGQSYETGITRIREPVTARQMQDADEITAAIGQLSEEHRLAIWKHAVVKLDKNRTFSAEAARLGIKRQELWRRIDKAFQALAVVLGSNGDCMQPEAVALGREIGENEPTIGHDTFWRGFTKLEAEQAAPIDFTRFLKRA